MLNLIYLTLIVKRFVTTFLENSSIAIMSSAADLLICGWKWASIMIILIYFTFFNISIGQGYAKPENCRFKPILNSADRFQSKNY